MRFGFALALDETRQGKHDRDAGDKNEQRENEIVEAKAFPVLVGELVAEKAADGVDNGAFAMGHFGYAPHRAIKAHDAEHVQATQRIDRYDAASLQNRR